MAGMSRSVRGGRVSRWTEYHWRHCVRGRRPLEGAAHLLLPTGDDLRPPRALLRWEVSVPGAGVLQERNDRMRVSNDPHLKT